MTAPRHPVQRGSVLMIVIVLIVMGGALAGALVKMMGNTSQGFRNSLAAAQALYLAQSGLELARFQLMKNGRCWTQNNWNSSTVTVSGIGQFEAGFKYLPGTGIRTLTGTGYAPSKADAQGRRAVQWTIPRDQCNGAALYAREDLRVRSSSRLLVNGSYAPQITGSDLGNSIDPTATPYTTRYHYYAVPHFQTYPAFPAIEPFPAHPGWSWSFVSNSCNNNTAKWIYFNDWTINGGDTCTFTGNALFQGRDIDTWSTLNFTGDGDVNFRNLDIRANGVTVSFSGAGAVNIDRIRNYGDPATITFGNSGPVNIGLIEIHDDDTTFNFTGGGTVHIGNFADDQSNYNRNAVTFSDTAGANPVHVGTFRTNSRDGTVNFVDRGEVHIDDFRIDGRDANIFMTPGNYFFRRWRTTDRTTNYIVNSGVSI